MTWTYAQYKESSDEPEYCCGYSDYIMGLIFEELWFDFWHEQDIVL
jgi:hypothetical protein